MTNIRSLLEAAALEPTRDFDADAFVRRALRPRRRRYVRWLGAILLGGLAVGVPTQIALSPAGRDEARVDTIDPPTTTSAPLPPSPSAPTTPVPAPGVSADERSVQRGATEPTTAPVDGATVATSPPFTAAGQGPSEGCRVYSRPSPDGHGPIVGPGEEGETVWTCEYRASVPAGYEGSGTWTLDIVRDGQTITFDSVTSPACADVGVIQPGDLVRARLGLRDSDGTPVRASAGDGEWHLQIATWIEC